MSVMDCFSGVDINDTGFGYTLSLIGGKYKMIIMYWLAEHQEVMRFNELKRAIGTISYKTLTTNLRELEADELIIRKEYPQIPPKVEYRLSERGKSLIPVLDMMCDWGMKNNKKKQHQEESAECKLKIATDR